MRSVLISIKPKYCELIALGKKTVEIRKTKPRLEPPFKVYVYCTKDEPLYRSGDKFWCKKANDFGNGKVIGEFVCDKILTVRYRGCSYVCDDVGCDENDRIAAASQLDLYDMRKYLSCNDGYAWHIKDLVMYDYPKYLIETSKKIKKAPHSWCYVDEMEV